MSRMVGTLTIIGRVLACGVSLRGGVSACWLMFDVRVGDCLELVKSLPDNSVDMILSDLPYGTTAAKWDSVLDWGVLWAEMRRVARPGSAIVLSAVQPFTSMAVASNPKLFKHEWIWDKVTGRGHLVAKKRPMQQHESVLVFEQNGNGVRYYPQMVERDKPIRGKGVESSRTELVGGKTTLVAPVGGKVYTHKYPKTILTFKPDKNVGHPTQKPVALFEYLIRTYTLPGGVVLDLTAGVLTTAVAAEACGRSSVCFEISQNYVDIGLTRLGVA